MKAIALTAAVLFSLCTTSLCRMDLQPETNVTPTEIRAIESNTGYPKMEGVDDFGAFKRYWRMINPLHPNTLDSPTVV